MDMNIPTVPLIIIAVLSIVWLILRYNFKKSRAGIASSFFAQLLIVIGIWIASLKINFIHSILKYFIPSSELSEVEIILTFIMLIVGMHYCAKVNLKALENYKGDYRLSDDTIEIKEGEASISLMWEMLKTRFLFFLQRKKDVVVKYPINKFIITDPMPEPSWKDFCVDLVCSENSDIIKETKEWSGSLSFWKIKKNNILMKKTEYIFLIPIENLELTHISENDLILKQVSEITKQNTDDYEIIIACDPINEQSFDKKINIRQCEVRVVSKTKLVTGMLDLTKYCKEIIKRYEYQTLFQLDIDDHPKPYTLKDTYIQAKVKKGNIQNNSDEKSQLFKDIISNWLEDKSQKQLALLGEFGQGKSSALLEYAASWARKFLNKEISLEDTRVPLLIELRGRSPMQSKGAEDFLGQWGNEHYGLCGTPLLNLIKAGKAILIFEGFDEIQSIGHKYDRYQNFNALWQFAFTSSKIIFTGRPNFFLDTDEAKSIMLTDRERRATNKPYTEIYSLEFLNISEIQELLRNIPPEISEEIIDYAKNNDEFQNIAKRPSMLPIIISEWKEIQKEKEQDKEITSSTIIDIYIKSSFLRKEKSDYQKDYQKVEWRIRYYLTQMIAVFMLENDGKNQITGKDIEKAIEMIYPSLDSIYLSEEVDAPMTASWQTFKKSFKEDEVSQKDYIRALAHDVRVNGIIASDSAGGADSFYFPHKQFYEFFVAKTYYEICKSPQEMQIKTLEKYAPGLHKAMKNEPNVALHLAMLFTQDEIESNKKLKKMNKDHLIINIVRYLTYCISYINLERFIKRWNKGDKLQHERKKYSIYIYFCFFIILILNLFFGFFLLYRYDEHLPNESVISVLIIGVILLILNGFSFFITRLITVDNRFPLFALYKLRFPDDQSVIKKRFVYNLERRFLEESYEKKIGRFLKLKQDDCKVKPISEDSLVSPSD